MLTKDERTIAVFALRYSYFRKTFAGSICVDHILKNIESFELWEIMQMIQETKDAIQMVGMASCDKETFVNLIKKLEENYEN